MDNRLEKVTYDELICVEAMTNYCILHTTAKKMIVYLTLKSLLHSLPPDRFIQVHKSYLINLGHIRSIRGNSIDLGGTEVIISQH